MNVSLGKKWFKIAIVALATLAAAYSIYFYLTIHSSQRAAIGPARAQLDSCLGKAGKQYSLSWTSACESYAKFLYDECQSCMDAAHSGWKLDSPVSVACRSAWPYPDEGTHCTLPTGRSDSVIKDYEQAKNDCYRSYPSGKP